MSQDAYAQPRCWCGSDESTAFSSSYRQCTSCGTLFLATPLPREHFEVGADETGFYGEKYWTQHVVADYGLPDIYTRTRTDIPERNLHWLRALLRYLLPEKKILEVACAHGSFVAMLRQAGFEASGLDVSPAILEYARKTFGIPTVLGPVEDAGLPAGQLDAIAAMDVLEHFTNPFDSMHRLAELLSENGLFLIQTPCLHQPDGSFADLQSRNDRFLVHLKEDEHIYLFNKSSARQFFERLGFSYIEFLEPIFDYDMFIVASRRPLTTHSPENIAQALTANLHRRMILALLDLDDRRRAVYDSWQEAERDRAARLDVISALNSQIGLVRANLAFSERDRANRLGVIEDMGARLSRAESSKCEAEAELAQLRSALQASETDRADRLKVIEDLGARLSAAESGRSEAEAELANLRPALQASETDRADRLKVIEDLGQRWSNAESRKLQAEAELATLRHALQAAESDRVAGLEIIETQASRLGILEQRIASLNRRNHELHGSLAVAIRDLEAVRQRFNRTLLGKTLTGAGWIRLPPAPTITSDDPSEKTSERPGDD